MKKISLFTLILTIVIFSGCSWFQKSNTQNASTSDISTTTPPPAVVDERLALCNVDPTPREIGDNQYPIAKKYEKLPRLGQIFTAVPCSATRLNAAFKEAFPGDGEYFAGSSLNLSQNPSSSLITTFKTIGYSCSKNSAENQCKNWKLEKSVDVNTLLQLEPYIEFFASDDCINCG